MNKNLLLGIALVLCPVFSDAFLPCGTSAPGVLNVGVLPNSLPWSDWDPITNTAIGFDPLLITAAAKLIGYDTVNFIGYGTAPDALADLSAGVIDVFAFSVTPLDTPPTSFIGVVTDISALSLGEVNGWQLNLGCCQLALQLEAALSILVENGTYAKILQLVRLNGWSNGQTLGIPVTASGVLQQPFEFASSESGTIPTDCAQFGPNFNVDLPQTNCVSAYLLANCTPTTTFTGATGLIPN